MNRLERSPVGELAFDRGGSASASALHGHREMEIKLLLNPRDLLRLRRNGRFKGVGSAPARTRNLLATYFDTVDFKLRDAGLTLRVRKEGRRFVQCVKAEDDLGGIFTRKEWEVFLPRPEPNPKAIEKMVGAKALTNLNAEDLIPVFKSRIRRVHRELTPTAGNRIALDMDVGQIEAGNVTEPICELELELLAGDPRQIYDFALSLIDEVPARLSTVAKSDRGYALVTGGRGRWRKAHPLLLTPAAPAEDAFARMIVNGIEHLQANEACALERNDVEGIHQMRVALRRLRSAFGLFRPLLPGDEPNELVEEIKWAMDELGPARDWDVFVTEVLDPIAAWQNNDPGVGLLRSEAEECRKAAYARAQATILSPRYTRMLLRLAGFADAKTWRSHPVSEPSIDLYGPTQALADRMIDTRHRKLLKAGRHFKEMTEEERHDLRIRVKKLRYAVDFFASLYPTKKVAAIRNALSTLQEGLGSLNDVAVARGLLAEITAKASGHTARELYRASGLVVGWHAHVAQDRIKGTAKAWRRFAGLKPFWRAP